MVGSTQYQADPARIMQLSTAYWDSQLLLTANRMNLFSLIDQGNHSTSDIAAAAGMAEGPAGLFLRALVSLGLLRQTDDKGFDNTPVTRAMLVSGGENYMGNSFSYADDLYSVWGELEQALRQGRPQLSPAAYLGDDSNRTRHFVYAMHDRALGTARTLVDLVDLGGRKRLLDVGGGPGTYAALFVRRYPQLDARVLELPGVAAIACEILADMGVADRVTTIAGDYYGEEFPADCDAILISGVFHRETAEGCCRLIEKARAALPAGGLLVIADVMTDASGCQPPLAALFGLNMLLTAENGGVHTDADISSWMEQAGFGSLEVQVFPPPMPHRVITGVKP